MPLIINNSTSIPDEELQFSAIRAQGAGGQNVNKVSSAIHLRFDIAASSLSGFYKERLLGISDNRLNQDGIIVIKAQRFRSQEKNREDALERLKQIIIKATAVQKTRRPTKPSKAAKNKRMDSKTKRGKTKALRGRVMD